MFFVLFALVLSERFYVRETLTQKLLTEVPQSNNITFTEGDGNDVELREVLLMNRVYEVSTSAAYEKVMVYDTSQSELKFMEDTSELQADHTKVKCLTLGLVGSEFMIVCGRDMIYYDDELGKLLQVDPESVKQHARQPSTFQVLDEAKKAVDYFPTISTGTSDSLQSVYNTLQGGTGGGHSFKRTFNSYNPGSMGSMGSMGGGFSRFSSSHSSW